MTNYNKIISDIKPIHLIDPLELAYKTETETEQPLEKEPIIRGIVNNCEHLNVRDASNINGKILCVIGKGTEITISPIYGVDIADDWVHVQLENGLCGYVMGNFLKEA